MVLSAISWLSENADSQQPKMSESYMRSNAYYAVKARETIPVAKDIPEDLFLKYVLPYRVVDEPVDDWRAGFFQVLAPYAQEAKSLRGAVKEVVPRIFTSLRASPKVLQKPNQSAVVFKSNSTPAMMAPVSETLTSGYASCTGTSILIVDGLRAVGIPARMVGTPQWNIPTGGNHNWVEVWLGDGWHFFDAVPDVQLDEAWFVPGNTKHADNKDTRHAIFAAEWAEGDATYPLTWRKPSVMWRAEPPVVMAKRRGLHRLLLATVVVTLVGECAFTFAGRRFVTSSAGRRNVELRAEKKYRVLVPIAEDSEEIETACITDVLTRAGADVTVASCSGDLQVRMSRGLKVVADKDIKDCKGETWDVIALPGGMPGAEHLRDNQVLEEMLKDQKSSGRVTAAVCASPAVVFAHHGLLESSATCYPAPKFKELVGSGWKDAKAVVDGNVITSQGPGTSLQFALKIVEEIYGEAKAQELAEQMVTNRA
ncbi:unnamed protein product [Cladocopium goreaui]|uniref:Protein DJ-1 homolog B (AtDJ1B) n=1 Tax=Cladocopium goreaui TaxID=2562237 RepID=A0A9P1G904_9DINO|nr:unnamed protein product [Cladocopium goreaui]